MPVERYGYFELRREAKYAGLSSKEIERTKLKEMFRDYGGIKMLVKCKSKIDSKNKITSYKKKSGHMT